MASSLREAAWKYRADLSAVAWSVACCWLVVWGNYAMLGLGVTVFYLIPIDLFGVPLVVTATFRLIAVLTGRI